jgi:uncharacterized radical SAM superfamily Fe-S cluster-containing enzyme
MDLFCAPCVTRQPTSHVYFGMTRSLCATCKRAVDAKVHFEDNRVWFHKYCPEHGHERVQVSSSVEWYLDALSFLSPSTPPEGPLRPVKNGCPFDCGPCASHQQRFEAPVANSIETSDLEAVPQRFAELLSSSHSTLVIDHPGIPEVHAVFAAHTSIVPSDFVPSPLAHPHCYSLLYVTRDGTPLARTLGRERLFDLLADGHELRGQGDVRAVHIHAHMDAHSFDVARVMRCSVASSDNVPLCASRIVRAVMNSLETPTTERRALPIVR